MLTKHFRWLLTVNTQGAADKLITVSQRGQQTVYLSRNPERGWKTFTTKNKCSICHHTKFKS